MSLFKRAERKSVKLKLALTGPSGSGKTFSALLLAKGLGKKIAVLDTENDSSQLYAGLEGMPEFDALTMKPPFTSDRYIRAINEATKDGYDVLIIDSVSHQWNGEGGIMDRLDKEKLAKPKANSFSLWSKYTPEHERFKQSIIQAPIHLIATIRSKSDFILQDNGNNKMTPTKVGMAPIQRDQFEYEFTTIFDISMEHFASVSKDRTNLFDGQTFKIDETIGLKILEWLASAKPADIPPPPNDAKPSTSENTTSNEVPKSEVPIINPQDAEFIKFKEQAERDVSQAAQASGLDSKPKTEISPQAEQQVIPPKFDSNQPMPSHGVEKPLSTLNKVPNLAPQSKIESVPILFSEFQEYAMKSGKYTGIMLCQLAPETLKKYIDSNNEYATREGIVLPEPVQENIFMIKNYLGITTE